jgi:2-amino-4-hydroxy-6-hydroxymethyldihydropteridine diphosphokinase
MVVKVETRLNPSSLLGAILMIEVLLGRVRNEVHYSSRKIDIDILFYGDQIVDKADLKIPHPLLPKRKFVMVPLCEIEPEMVHPVLKKSMVLLLEMCEDKSIIRKFR